MVRNVKLLLLCSRFGVYRETELAEMKCTLCIEASSLTMFVLLIVPSIRSLMSALVSDHEQGTSQISISN